MTENNYIIGTCEKLCPLSEIKLRKSRNLVHYYEKRNGMFIKEFTRSAADHKMEKPESLRTFKALQNTLDYLFDIILLDREKPLNYRYDFIFDRCRAVRQEIVIQNFSSEATLELLEPIVMFLSYSLYKLNSLAITLFDIKICRQHLHECLLKCLACYEEIDENDNGKYKMENRVIVEGINLMLNINDFNALQRAVKLDSSIKSMFTLGTCIKISINFHQHNFHRVLHDIQELPHLVGAIASLNLSQIRKEVLRIFTIAYNSQTLMVPLDFIHRLLIYDRKSDLLKHLCDLGIHENVNEDETLIAVNFNRKKFDSSKFISNSHQHFVDNKLDDFHIPDLILLKKCVT